MTAHPLRRPPRPEPRRGVTLIVALVVLTALGLIAAAAMRASTANIRVVDNTQVRQQAFVAAQAAIERTISTPAFTQTPDVVAATPVEIDVDGDGRTDMTARLTPAPSCYRWRPIKVSELDPAIVSDRACLGTSSAVNSGIEGGAGTGDSLCAASEWNVRAVVADPVTNADVRVNQGVEVRGLITEVNTTCP